MKKRELTLAERLRISALSKAGRRQHVIATEMGLDIRHVRKEQKLAGLPIHRPGLPQGVVDRIVAMKKAGKQSKEIIARTKVNQCTVRRYLHLAGLPTLLPVFEIPPKVEADILRRIKRHERREKIAKRAGLTLYYVRKIAYKNGIHVPRGLSPVLREKIHKFNGSLRVTARKLGVSPNTVFKIRRTRKAT